jgi:hypothetical protein
MAISPAGKRRPDSFLKCMPRPVWLSASRTALAAELETERVAEMEADKVYWRPLIRELEAMHLARFNRSDDTNQPGN